MRIDCRQRWLLAADQEVEDFEDLPERVGDAGGKRGLGGVAGVLVLQGDRGGSGIDDRTRG